MAQALVLVGKEQELWHSSLVISHVSTGRMTTFYTELRSQLAHYKGIKDTFFLARKT